MNIVDLAQARAWADSIVNVAGADAARDWVHSLADEVESLEREVGRLRAELTVMKGRALHIATHSPDPEAAGAALRILGQHRMHLPEGQYAARQERAAKLRADAAYWTGVAVAEIDGEKKAMAEELARSLSEQAKEVDL